MRTRITDGRVQTFVDVHAYISSCLWVHTARPSRLKMTQVVATVIAATVPIIAFLIANDLPVPANRLANGHRAFRAQNVALAQKVRLELRRGIAPVPNHEIPVVA